MLNRLNSRYILRIIFIAIALYISLFLSIKTNAYATLDSIVERFTVEYLQREYKEDKIKFVYITKEDMEYIQNDKAQLYYYLSDLLNNNFSRTDSVIFDFVLPESGDVVADNALAKALNNVPSSVIAYEDSYFGNQTNLPYQQFHKNASYRGYRNFAVDDNGHADKYYPLIDVDRNAVSLIIAAAEANDIQIGHNAKHMLSIVSRNSNDTVQLSTDDSFVRIPINFTFKSKYLLRDVLVGRFQTYTFDNSIVIIGFEEDIVNTSYGKVTHAEYIANGSLALAYNFTYSYASLVQTFIFALFLLLSIFITEKSTKWWVRFSVLIFVIPLAFMINYASALFFNLYFHLSLPVIFTLIVFFYTTVISYFTVREELVRDSSVMNEIMVLNNIKISESTFSTYLISIAPTILQKSGIEIVRPELHENAPLLKKLFSDADLNHHDIVFKRGYILIPLSNYKKESSVQRFCLLKSKMLVSDSSVKNIVAFILSIDFHFKHIIETERENKLLYSAIEGIILSLNARDAITGEHSKRVAEFSVQIGEWLDYSDRQLEKLYFASLIHDIGKIGISDNILAKPSFFSNEDFDIMKSHPALGAEIMGSFLEDEDIKAAILQHHERPDGKGYPNGLTKNQIRPIASIVKIADVYDALTSARQYKDAWPINRVCDIFHQGRGTEFDEDLIDLVLNKIKPADWEPPIDNMDNPIYFSNQAKVMAIDIYKTAMYHTRGFTSEETTAYNLDFSNITSVLDLSLGDSVTSNGFLYKNPVLVHSNEEKEHTYYAKTNKGNYHNAVLLFLRNFHTGGAIISGLGEEKSKFSEEVLESLGEPLFVDKSLSAWIDRSMYYVLFESQSSELENVLVYFNKYILFAEQ